MGTFNFSTSSDSLNIALSGSFDKPTVASFISKFNTEVKKIQPAKCQLVVEVSEMQVQPAEMQDTLKGCFQLYESAGFKKIIMNVGNNVILAMQARRIAKDAGLSNVEVK